MISIITIITNRGVLIVGFESDSLIEYIGPLSPLIETVMLISC